MSFKYDPDTDSFIHIKDEEPNTAQPNVQDSVKDADCISRRAAIDIINADKTPPNTPFITPTAKRDFEIYDSACDRHIKMIGDMPSAEPEQKTGYWEYCRDMDGWHSWLECSKCGRQVSDRDANYCPYCGSKNR